MRISGYHCGSVRLRERTEVHVRFEYLVHPFLRGGLQFPNVVFAHVRHRHYRVSVRYQVEFVFRPIPISFIASRSDYPHRVSD